MIKLLNLSFQNIGRFVEKQTIDFSTKQKLLQIDGQNENTGGSSGSGKSTVFHAHDYLLGLNDIPATSLQSRLTKEGIWVSGDYLIDGVPVTITRSKKDGLVIKTPIEIIEGNIKIGEEVIDKFIGIPRNLFAQMTHKKQKKGGFFLELTGKQTYDFLGEALGLQEYEAKTDKIDLDIEIKTKTLTSLTAEIENIERNLESLRSTLNSVEKPEVLDIEDLHKQVEAEELLLNSYIAKKAEIRSRCDDAVSLIYKDVSEKLIPEPETDNAAELERLRSELSEISSNEIKNKMSLDLLRNETKTRIKAYSDKINEIKYKERQLKTTVSEIVALKAQEAHLLVSKCNTCLQEWRGDSLDAKLVEVKNSIQSKTSDILDIRSLLETAPALENGLESCELVLRKTEDELNNVSKEYIEKKAKTNFELNNIIQSNFNKLHEWKLKNQEILNQSNENKFRTETSFLKQVETFNESIALGKQKISDLSTKLYTHKINSDYYDKVTTSTQLNISKNEDDFVKKQTERAKTQQTISIALESKRLIKTYVLQIFQDTLNFIGHLSTKILNAVPAMNNATVYFESFKESKTGKIKDEVNCVINLDGEDNIPVKTLSGGERTAVDLAVDLAVIEVIESQTGKGASWIVLDEPFEGLDSIGQEAAVEIIKQVGLRKQVMVVSHGSETKELIEETVTISRKGSYSTVL